MIDYVFREKPMKLQRYLKGYKEYVYSIAVYKKISNEVGRINNFRALARKLSFLPTELDIFIYGKTIYVFYLSFNV